MEVLVSNCLWTEVFVICVGLMASVLSMGRLVVLCLLLCSSVRV